MRRTLILAIVLGLLTACGGGDGLPSTYVQASIDGVTWSAEASEGVVVYTVDDPDGAGRIFTIGARKVGAGSQSFALTLPNPPDLGTHPLDGVAAGAAWSSCPDDILADCISWAPTASDPGSLTITHVDPATGRIEGTFAFDAHIFGDSGGAVKHVTAGKFVILAPSVFVLE